MTAARLPARPRQRPAALVSPPEQAAAWDRLVGTERLPACTDPPEGVLISANQEPPREPAGEEIAIGWFFSSADRARRLSELLAGRGRLSVADLRAMQADVLHAPSLRLRDWLMERLADLPARPPLRRLAEALGGWDGRYGADSAGALACQLLLFHLARRLCADRLAAYGAVWRQQGMLAADLRAMPRPVVRAALSRAVPPAARRDQEPLWLRGEYLPLPLRPETVRRRFPHRLDLHPG